MKKEPLLGRTLKTFVNIFDTLGTIFWVCWGLLKHLSLLSSNGTLRRNGVISGSRTDLVSQRIICRNITTGVGGTEATAPHNEGYSAISGVYG